MARAADEDQLMSLGDTCLYDQYQTQDRPGVIAPPKPDTTRDDDGQLFVVAEEAPFIPGDDGDDDVTGVHRRYPEDEQKLERGDLSEPIRLARPPDSQVIVDMQDANHGFLIREQPAPKTVWRTTCEVCDGPLPLIYEEWFCELGAEPGTVDWWCCECVWCQLRGQWLRGEYRPRGGRPLKQCGTAECKRRAARERQRKSRATRKAALSQKPL